MATIEEQILALSEADLETFPLGIIRLDRSGTILHYNRAEAELARQTTPTVGLNFFRDVAPCTAVKDFQGRFDDFVATPGSRIEQFSFLFRFAWGNRRVNISLVRRSGSPESFYIVVNAPPV